jgi:hypothetical protein
MMIQVLKVHETDPNFPVLVLQRIHEFLDNEDLFKHPENYGHLIYEIKTEAALIVGNSPYAEVRAVVSNIDDVNMPCSTIRAWVSFLSFPFLPLRYHGIGMCIHILFHATNYTKYTGDRSSICCWTGFHKPTVLYPTTSHHGPSQCSTAAVLSVRKGLGKNYA